MRHVSYKQKDFSSPHWPRSKQKHEVCIYCKWRDVRVVNGSEMFLFYNQPIMNMLPTVVLNYNTIYFITLTVHSHQQITKVFWENNCLYFVMTISTFCLWILMSRSPLCQLRQTKTMTVMFVLKANKVGTRFRILSNGRW